MADLNKIFDEFNSMYFNNELRKVPVIPVDPKHKNYNRYVSDGIIGRTKWFKSDITNKTYIDHIQILVGGNTLNNEILGTLLHEMVHHWCMDDKAITMRQRCSTHTKKFTRKCLQIYKKSGNKYPGILGYDTPLDCPKVLWLVKAYLQKTFLNAPFNYTLWSDSGCSFGELHNMYCVESKLTKTQAQNYIDESL